MEDRDTTETGADKRNRRRVLWGGVIAALAIITVLAVVLPGGDGGNGNGNGNKSPFEGHPAPKVTFVSPKTVQRNTTFSTTVNISEVVSLWGTWFDVEYNPDIITLVNYSAGVVGGVPPDGLLVYRVGPGEDGEGLLRVLSKWDDYSDANNGFGVNGSGYICRLVFAAGAKKGTTGFNFPVGKGEEPGERKVMRIWNGTVYGLDLKDITIKTTVHILPPEEGATPAPNTSAP